MDGARATRGCKTRLSGYSAYNACQPGVCESYQSHDITVHPRFAHFFLMLWFVCKIEHVIRNSTRCWLDSILQLDETVSVSSLCNQFVLQKGLIEKTHIAFLHGLSHVTLSLRNHFQETGVGCSNSINQ